MRRILGLLAWAALVVGGLMFNPNSAQAQQRATVTRGTVTKGTVSHGVIGTTRNNGPLPICNAPMPFPNPGPVYIPPYVPYYPVAYNPYPYYPPSPYNYVGGGPAPNVVGSMLDSFAAPGVGVRPQPRFGAGFGN